jgi:DNA-binding Lrp family transcriptional regulator
MSVEAYIFINVRAGWARKIIRDMSEMPEVKNVHACWGRPDLIAHVEVGDEAELRELILSRIHNLEGVSDTDTHIAVKF